MKFYVKIIHGEVIGNVDPYLDIEKAQQLGINTIWVNSKELNFDNLCTVVVNNVEKISVDLIESIKESKKL